MDLETFAAAVQTLAPRHYTSVGYEVITLPIAGTQEGRYVAYAKGIAVTGRTPEEATDNLRLRLENSERMMATFNKTEAAA